ncbi:hypothetical protein H2200_000686 [Cladophialophora chaetospira]|uniref:NmrA-like domain-containing protein n=1 Tax=Cladophialophora chaetospira TaxID=386627 RepID=A0AA38XP93_9EURO|nr:hypothetical protein H2200_000686 [Cladophialophora chaetospira]
MVVVAVAGGSGNLGRTIVEVLRESTRLTVLVIGRKTASRSPDDSFLAVDYANVDATAQLLAEHKVHTIISTIQGLHPTASDSQVSLIRAAGQSSSVKRIIAGGFGALPAASGPTTAFQVAADEELRKTKLEWTRFVVGFFLDYYAVPKIKTHMPPLCFAVDMDGRKAAIPGTGNEIIAFTYSFDVAKFVAAALDLETWPETTYCYGEKTTFNEFVKLAEQLTGSRFKVEYDALEKLHRGEMTELPAHKSGDSKFPEAVMRGLLTLLGSWVVDGLFNVPEEGALNHKFPEIKPMSIRDALLLRQNVETNKN